MPEFCNPSDILPDQGECMVLSAYDNNNQPAKVAPKEAINVIDVDIGTVGYNKSGASSKRSLSENSYDYEQYLKANSFQDKESRTELSDENESIDKHFTKTPFRLCKNTKLFLWTYGFLQLCALFMIGYTMHITTKEGKYKTGYAFVEKYK